MSSINQSKGNRESPIHPTRSAPDLYPHQSSHANAEASSGSRQWNGDSNFSFHFNTPSFFQSAPSPSNPPVETDGPERTGQNPGELRPQIRPVAPEGLIERRATSNSANSSPRRSAPINPSTGGQLPPSSTRSWKRIYDIFSRRLPKFVFVIVLLIVLCLGISLVRVIGGFTNSTSGQTPYVRRGYFNSWVDYDYPWLWQRRITLSETEATFLVLSTVLILTLLLPSTYTIIHRIGYRVLSHSTHHFRHDLEDNGETTSLIKGKNAAHNWSSASRIFASSRSVASSVRSLMGLVSQNSRQTQASIWPGNWEYIGRFSIATAFSLFILTIFFALAVGVLMSKRLLAGSVVLSRHPDCGLWLQNSIASPVTPGDDRYEYTEIGEETEASEYAKKCYHSAFGYDGCNTFLTQRISYHIIANSQCPFEESLCLEGRESGYSLTTGIVSSKKLGINVPIGYSFRRNTTCSPVKRRANLSEDGNTYEYNYGASEALGNITWKSPAKPLWQFSGYDTAIFYWTPNSTTFNWQPSTDFKPWVHQAITLILIQSKKNYHPGERRDPIFPASQRVLYGPGNIPVYFNEDPIATAIACVDTTEVCTADGGVCFSNIHDPEPELPELQEIIGYYMLLISLSESTTFNAIAYLGSRALVAFAKLQLFISLPLHDEQWKVEVEHLFESSLARLSITLQNIIRGAAAKHPKYRDRTSAGMEGMCDAYKFPGHDLRNITVFGIVFVICIAAAICVLSFEFEVDRSAVDLQSNTDVSETDTGLENHETILVVEMILDAILGVDGRQIAKMRKARNRLTSIVHGRVPTQVSIGAAQGSQEEGPSENGGNTAESDIPRNETDDTVEEGDDVEGEEEATR